MSSPRMNRRSAIKAPLAAAATTAGAALATPGLAQSRTDLNISLLEGSLRNQELASRLSERLAQTSENRIRLRLARGSDPLGTLSQVGSGQLSGYLGTSEDLMGADPVMGAFTAMPFGMSSLEFEAWIHQGGGQQIWDDVMSQFGVKPILLSDEGPRFAGWFRAPLAGANALKGVRFNSTGLGDVAVQALGGTPVRADSSRIASESDASISYGLNVDMGLGLHRSFSTLVTPSLFQPHRAVTLGINANVWSGLSADDQMLITSCCEAEANSAITERLQQDMTSFLELKNANVAIAAIDEATFVSMGQQSTTAIGDMLMGNSAAPHVFDAYQAFLSEISGWTWVGEALFSVARSNALRSA